MKSIKGENLIQINFIYKIEPFIIFGRNERLTQIFQMFIRINFFLYELSVTTFVTDT